jgi:putative redox protein
MSLTATARRLGDGLRHQIDVNGRHTIITDEPAGLGGSDTGPAPHELLPATLAACVSTMIALYAQRKGWDLGELTVKVTYDPESVPRAFDVAVALPDDVSEEQIERLTRVADTCPVRRALETGFTFHETIDRQARITTTSGAPAARLRASRRRP